MTAPLADVPGRLEDLAGVLGVALAQWARRDDSRPQPEVRQSANTAMGAVDAEWVSRRFKALAKAAGLPVIRFHAARHSAVSLMFDAGVDVKIVQEVLGHSTSAITRDTYTHVRRKRHQDAADQTVTLLPGAALRETKG
ncbi:MAG TPA: tyrosine-type recombinase/integrase [Streptosporangiaceae bacterium]|nr:tyrosine-type recombinase/integrase [Streptosporangiaceae bacterium]